MANITFTIPSVLNRGGGEKKIEISASTITEAFSKISDNMGDEFKRRVLNDDGTPRSLINIYINGKNARFSEGMNTSLKDGDEVYILPAVAGGSDLSSKELDRYSRQVMLEEIGYQGQLKLKGSKVCVVGVGGLGNPITSKLVAMGIGKLRIVDRDVIELSNLHRQTMFDEADVGQVKVEVAAPSRLSAANLRRRLSLGRISTFTLAVPFRSKPNSWAARRDKSMMRPRAKGPRSLTRSRTVRPFSKFVTRTALGNGSVRCAAVIRF